MPKLRNRKTLSAPTYQLDWMDERQDLRGAYRKWTYTEDLKLRKAIEEHGTRDLKKLEAAVGTKTAKSIQNHFTNCMLLKKNADRAAQLHTPLQQWMDLLAKAVPDVQFYKRTDEVGLVASLRLAAEEEDRLAAAERRDSLAGVYRFLMDIADGTVPPDPAEADARRVLAQMHHLAALVRTISLDRHKRWLWSSPVLRKVVRSKRHLKAEEVPVEEPDLTLAPADQRQLIGRLLEPDTNPLRMPAALAINPLISQLNEQALRDELELLADGERLWSELGVKSDCPAADEQADHDHDGDDEEKVDPMASSFSWPMPAPTVNYRRGSRKAAAAAAAAQQQQSPPTAAAPPVKREPSSTFVSGFRVPYPPGSRSFRTGASAASAMADQAGATFSAATAEPPGGGRRQTRRSGAAAAAAGPSRFSARGSDSEEDGDDPEQVETWPGLMQFDGDRQEPPPGQTRLDQTEPEQ